jgi:sensitive to high expression protein 9, mitochondrial
MNLAGSHGVRRAVQTAFQTHKTLVSATIASKAPQRWSSLDYQTPLRRAESSRTFRRDEGSTQRRRIFTSRILRDSKKSFDEQVKPSSTLRETTPEPGPSTVDDAASNLPSSTELRRSHLSKRLTEITDSILARASIAGQHINAYTGTDYTGIEALRTQITAQETAVRSCHEHVESARVKHQEAHTKQASAQKEIVGLLERKSSWSPADLERYMSLVRSEHTNDQAVQSAQEGLAIAERDLENARSLLERLERKQYHEEQIWSDTIRRNSTWVTFGLMGVNLVLLLAQIAVFEPWRRRRIVKEVERVVEEKVVSHSGPSDVEKQVDDVVEPKGVTLELVESSSESSQGVLDATPDTLLKQLASMPSQPTAAETFPADVHPAPPKPLPPETWTALWESYLEKVQDLFSERLIQVKKVDLTTTALQGAATGVAAMGLLFVFFRPR